MDSIVARLINCLLLATIVLACDAPPPIELDSRLQPYIDAFVAEAMKRGLNLDAAQLNAVVVDVREASGQCESTTTGQSTLRIDEAYWKRADALQREFLIFHELGHCLLDRRHLDTKRADGTCTSMMHSISTICENAYNQDTRSSYLDELFSPRISAL